MCFCIYVFINLNITHMKSFARFYANSRGLVTCNSCYRLYCGLILILMLIIIASVYATRVLNVYRIITSLCYVSLCFDWMFKSVQCSTNNPGRYCKYNILYNVASFNEGLARPLLASCVLLSWWLTSCQRAHLHRSSSVHNTWKQSMCRSDVMPS